MNISEVRKQIVGASYEKDVEVLEKLYNNTGNCVMNGFLGSSITNISYDDIGKLEFQSVHMADDLTTISTGVVLDAAVVIRQTQENDRNKYSQIFSWKKDGSSYTYIAFDQEDVMGYAYEQIKRYHPKFLGENIDQDLRELGIPFDNIMDVKVSQKVENVDTVSSMVDEAMNYTTNSNMANTPLML